jgi:tRNA pseudouridine55 synthase
MRDIEIFNIENISYNLNIVTFDIKVSKGTYIRTIVSELGEFINSTAIVNNLKRINIGSLSSEDSRLISNVEALK